MTTAAEKAEKNPGAGVNAGEKNADKTAVSSAAPGSSGAPPVDKRRALGRGLESLLGGPDGWPRNRPAGRFSCFSPKRIFYYVFSSVVGWCAA